MRRGLSLSASIQAARHTDRIPDSPWLRLSCRPIQLSQFISCIAFHFIRICTTPPRVVCIIAQLKPRIFLESTIFTLIILPFCAHISFLRVCLCPSGPRLLGLWVHVQTHALHMQRKPNAFPVTRNLVDSGTTYFPRTPRSSLASPIQLCRRTH